MSLELGLISQLDKRLEDLHSLVASVLPPDMPTSGLRSMDLDPGDTALTTNGNVFVSCLNTATATVTLNPLPVDGENAVIWRAASSVIISGPFLNTSSCTIFVLGDSYDCKFSASANAWAIT